MSEPLTESIRSGYAFDGAVVTVGAFVDETAEPDLQIRIPMSMLNRHGLIAGATGTGKTKTLQVLAEQIADQGVAVFAADIKGDLSGLAVPGESSEKLLARTQSIAQAWEPTASAVEFFTLGTAGEGVPLRATVESFGSVLLSKILDLNATQESSLSLVFSWARKQGLPLVSLDDLRAVLLYLDSAEGKPELKSIGGISAATMGVILRELTAFEAEGADEFFGLPELDVENFLRNAPDGRGIISLLELPGVQDKPLVFSTFLMHVLRQLFAKLPEVGDTDRPKLVFFFDEAHLLFKDASKDFLDIVIQTVRLIRSKGVGVFFVTQTPKDVPADVLAQLGSRIQHQLRAHTPADAKALKATVETFPTTSFDLAETLTSLEIGEAIVTVMSDKGAPTPVAKTRVRAPQSSMSPAPADVVSAIVANSQLPATQGASTSVAGAADVLRQRQSTATAQAEPAADRIAQEADRLEKQNSPQNSPQGSARKKSSRQSQRMSPVDRAIGEASRTFARELVKVIFRKR